MGNSIAALAEELHLTEEFIKNALATLEVAKLSKPKTEKKQKSPKKPAEQVASDGFEEETEGRVVYKDEDLMEHVVAERGETVEEPAEAPEETEVVEVPEEVTQTLEDDLE